MNFDSTKLREFLAIMKESGVDSGSMDGFTFKFGIDLSANSKPQPLPESPEERYEYLKEQLIQANKEELEIENWSAS